MTDYFTKELRRLEHENLFLKAQRNELLEAARAAVANYYISLWQCNDTEAPEWVKRLEAAVEKAEGRAA
jgi:hypothetical protein